MKMKKYLVSLLMMLMLCSCSLGFNQEKWLNEPEKRQGMVGSLTSTHQLEGMTEDDIIVLLGEPTSKQTEPNREFQYFMGYAGAFGIKAVIYEVKFDEQGTVVTHDTVYK